MSSITKNPMILTSVNYVLNWYIANAKDKKTISLFNTLNMIQSDKIVVESLLRNKEKKDKYYNFEERSKGVNDV